MSVSSWLQQSTVDSSLYQSAEMKFITASIILCGLASLHCCQAARILAIQLNSARSHNIVVDPLFDELAARGHQLTVASSYPRQPPLPNVRDIDFSKILISPTSNLSYSGIREGMTNPFKTPFYMADIDLIFCEAVLSDPVMQNLYKSDEKFDLVMLEIFVSDCLVPFARRFKAPLVAFITSTMLPWAVDRVGVPDNPSYIPNYFVDLSSDMWFLDRVYNSFMLVWTKLVFKLYAVPKTNSLVRKYLGDDIPPVEELIQNTSLLLVNSHVSFSQARPLPPNVVEIGGIHIRESKKPLPEEWRDIMDRAQNGVILFSFGSMVKMSSIPRATIDMFLGAFSRLPQTVIFKYEEDLLDAPTNVVVRKWLPQRQIMEHNQTKLLLAHGGLASTIEALHFGKPFIGMPLFADQFLNVRTIVCQGAGLMLHLESLSEQKIYETITEVLNNNKYSENAKRLSRQFRDRPLTALQTAVYWTEYVIRHRGASHLRPSSVDLPLYQYLLLDVIALLLLPLLPIFYLIYFLFFRAVEVSPNDYRNYIKNKKED